MKKKLLTGLLLSISILIRTIQAYVPQEENPGYLNAGFEKTIKDRNSQVSFINKLGRALGFQIKPNYKWQDNKGKTFWSIKNKTSYFIKAKSDAHSNLIIAPGKTDYLYRDKKWNVTIELEKKDLLNPEKTLTRDFKNEISTKKHKEHEINVYLKYEITKEHKIGGIVRPMIKRTAVGLKLKAIGSKTIEEKKAIEKEEKIAMKKIATEKLKYLQKKIKMLKLAE